MYASLYSEGIALISKQPDTELSVLIKKLGKVILDTDVKINSEAPSLVQSAEPLEWHQDSPEARWIVWHCVNPGFAQREPTELVDSAPFVNQLAIEDKTMLMDSPIVYRSVDGSLQNAQILSAGAEQLKLYYCPWLIEERVQNYSCVKKVSDFLNGQEPYQHFWNKGDVLIIDNHRVLHRRGRLSSTSRRHLKRYWISCE